MTPSTDTAAVAVVLRRVVAVAVASVVLGGFGLTGCSVVKAVKNVEQRVKGNKSTIDAFTNKMNSGAASTFEATYTTTGTSPTTVLYAVQPPTGLAFQGDPSGSSTTSVNIVVNSSGEYTCTPPGGSSSGWSCQKLGTADAATQNKIFDFYTPSHWMAFLKDFSLAAGFAGDKVTQSTMAVNGFNLQCVDFNARVSRARARSARRPRASWATSRSPRTRRASRSRATPPHRRRRCSSYHRAPRSRPPHPVRERRRRPTTLLA